MKKLILLFIIFSFLFSCNNTTAYKEFKKNQQIYTQALLENNKPKKIKALQKIIKCGKYLKINTQSYQEKLKKLLPHTKLKLSPSPKLFKKKTKREYIKIISFNPLKIKTSHPIKVYTEYKNKTYKKIIDIQNAITPKPFIYKKYKDYKLKIAQFNKSIVRIVFYYTKKLNIKIDKNKNLLSIYIHPKNQIKNSLSKQVSTPPIIKKYKKIIVIDPGHGGKDDGGIGIGKRKEKFAVLQIAKYLKRYLEKEGYKVYMTRNRDIFRKLKWRTHFANIHNADLFISIHCNISPHHERSPRGIETYFLSPARSKRAIEVAKTENRGVKGLNYLDQNVILNFLNKDRIIASTKFAIDVQSNMLKSLRRHFKYVKDGGVRPAPFWVLVGTQMPAILIETGFLTNPMEARRLFNPYYQKLLAKGIAKGVKEYFRKNSK